MVEGLRTRVISARLRIVVADDNLPFREGLVLILNNQPDMAVVGQCGTGLETIELVSTLRPDVTILDLELPSIGIAIVVAKMLRSRPTERILLLSTFVDFEDVYRAVRSGARGYLNKGCGKSEMLRAIREICQGRRYFLL